MFDELFFSSHGEHRDLHSFPTRSSSDLDGVPHGHDGRGHLGGEGFRELLKDAYFYGTNGVLAVADVTRRRTLDDLDDWIDGVEHEVGKVPILIAVNKTDLTSGAQFDADDVAQFAKAYNAEFFETSAKTGEHVEDAFRRLGGLVAEHQLQLA